MSRYQSCVWKPYDDVSTRSLQKDILCWHTLVSGSIGWAWDYFNTGAGGRGVYSHGLLGGGWGADLRDGLDGVAWQGQDTDLRGASNLDGNWHVIAFETADNAARPIQPWTPKQCTKIVAVCAEANQVDGIPLLIIPDSKIGRRGVGYHRLGCDPYRVDDGELWSGAYGKDCPTDPRIRQLPALVDQARIVVAGGNPPTESDVLEEFMGLYETAADYESAVRKATAAGVRDALKDYLPRMVMAVDGRANTAFSGDFVAQAPGRLATVLQQIAANTTPAAPDPTQPVASARAASAPARSGSEDAENEEA